LIASWGVGVGTKIKALCAGLRFASAALRRDNILDWLEAGRLAGWRA